jgi:hypothetical protein
MGSDNIVTVWVGVDVSSIMMLRGGLFKEKGEFYSYYKKTGEEKRDYIAIKFHRYVEEEKKEMLKNSPVEFMAFSDYSVAGRDVGWGIEVCSNLTNIQNPKTIYDKAEELKNVYKNVIKKYFSEEEAEILIGKMKIHTNTLGR